MKRRELLKTAALGALAGADLALGQEGQAARSPASDRIGIGMIGVGGFGLSANLPDFLRNPDVDVVANRLVVGTYREPWTPKGL